MSYESDEWSYSNFARKKAKYWVFTLNNYTTEEVEAVRSCLGPDRGCPTYICWGHEVGNSGNPHLQGYLEFAERVRGSTVKRVAGLGRAHFEPRRGTQEQAIEYTQKEVDQEHGAWYEYGIKSSVSQGKRTDLDEAVDAIKEGASVRELWKDHTKVMIRYHKGMELAVAAHKKRKKFRTFPLESFPFHPIIFEEGYAHVLVGPSGCGKTSYLKSLFPEALFVSHMDDLTQFDSDMHSAIIFDDMSFTHMPRTAQIHVVDYDDDRSIHVRYQTAFIPAGTKKFFTTNIREIFDLEDAAIKRRVKVHTIQTIEAFRTQ